MEKKKKNQEIDAIHTKTTAYSMQSFLCPTSHIDKMKTLILFCARDSMRKSFKIITKHLLFFWKCSIKRLDR